MKRSLLSSVCWRNVSSTTNPLRARSIEGCSAFFSGQRPQRSSAVSQVAGVPGVPTETPLVTSSGVNRYGWPVSGSMKASCGIAAGAVSRPSSVCTLPLFAS